MVLTGHQPDLQTPLWDVLLPSRVFCFVFFPFRLLPGSTNSFQVFSIVCHEYPYNQGPLTHLTFLWILTMCCSSVLTLSNPVTLELSISHPIRDITVYSTITFLPQLLSPGTCWFCLYEIFFSCFLPSWALLWFLFPIIPTLLELFFLCPVLSLSVIKWSSLDFTLHFTSSQICLAVS